jgi:hypothetical protein
MCPLIVLVIVFSVTVNAMLLRGRRGSHGAAAEAMSRRVHLLLVFVGLIVVWQGLYLMRRRGARGPSRRCAIRRSCCDAPVWSHFSETAKAFAFALTIARLRRHFAGRLARLSSRVGRIARADVIGFASIRRLCCIR